MDLLAKLQADGINVMSKNVEDVKVEETAPAEEVIKDVQPEKVETKVKVKEEPVEEIKEEPVEEIKEELVEEVKEEPVKAKNEITLKNTSVTREFSLLPSVEKLLSGRVAIIGEQAAKDRTVNSVFPIQWIKVAQAINAPDFLGKVIYGKEPNIKEFPTDKVIIPLVAHTWFREKNFNGEFLDEPIPTITLYFYSPEDKQLYAISGQHYAADSMSVIANKSLRAFNISAERKQITRKNKQTAVIQVPVFTEVEYDGTLDVDDLQEKMGFIDAHIERFYESHPHQDFRGMGNVASLEETAAMDDEIPF